VREVHPGDVHAVLDELEEDLGTAAGRPDGAHDSGQTHPNTTTQIKTELSIPICKVRVLVIIISVANPDPGSGMGVKSRSGSGKKIPDNISESLETIFGFKKTSRMRNTDNNLGDIFVVNYRNLKALLSSFEGSKVLRIKY
jgi:hypothetical protein